MTTPLLTTDARMLRQLVRPRWQRRLFAWVTLIAAGVVVAIRLNHDEPGLCSEASPCAPSYLGTVCVGLLLAASVVAFLHGRTALWLGAGYAVTDVLSMLGQPVPTEWAAWLYGSDVAFVAACALVAAAGRDRRPLSTVETWLATVPRGTPATPVTPRTSVGRLARSVSVAFLLAGLALAGWVWLGQIRVEEQQRGASRVPGEVVRVVDEVTLEVRLAGTATAQQIDVYRSIGYHPGQRLDFYTDDHGLLEPISEPYDITGWIALAVVLAGVGVGWRLRARDRAAGLRALYADAVPMTRVYVRRGNNAMTIYAGDARPGEPPLATVGTESRVRDEDPDALHPDDAGQLAALGLAASSVQPTEQAVLYGLPITGHWCAVAIGAEQFTPHRPVPARASGLLFTNPVTAGPAAPRQLREEEVEALRPDDTDPNPEQVRSHRQHPLVGYGAVLGAPLLLLGVANPLTGLPAWAAVTIAAATVAVSCAVGWAFTLRSRLSWNAGGVAVVGAIGAARLRWSDVVRIDADPRDVTIVSRDAGFVVSAGGGFGPLRDRPAEELANALRYARQRASAGTDPPALVLPATSRMLPVIWIGYTPVLVWLLHLVALAL